MTREANIYSFIQRYRQTPTQYTMTLDIILFGGHQRREDFFNFLTALQESLGFRMTKYCLFVAIGQKLESKDIPYLSMPSLHALSFPTDVKSTEIMKTFLCIDQDQVVTTENAVPQSIKIQSQDAEKGEGKVKVRKYKGTTKERRREFLPISLLNYIRKASFQMQNY